MKKIFIFLGVVFFSFCLKQNIFAYTFPSDFNYQLASSKMDSNCRQYGIGDYFISRYPYTGDDSNYSGKYTQNYSWSSPVYAVGFIGANDAIDYFVFSQSQFTSERYDVADSFVSNSSVLGNTQTGVGIGSGSNFGNNYNDLRTMFVNSGDTWYFSKGSMSAQNAQDWYYNFSVWASVDDFLQSLYEHNYDIPSGSGGESGSSGDLPFLTYTLKQQIAPNVSFPTVGMAYKEIFTWDYAEKEPYASSPQNYTFDIMAYANFKNVTENGITSEVFDRDNLSVNESNRVYLTRGGQNIAINNFSWMYTNIGNAVYSKSGKLFSDDSINSITLGYIVAIRTRDNANTVSSFWKLFIVQAGGNVYSTGKVITNNGDIIDSTADNSDDGMNGTGQGGTSYTTDSNTTAGDDTTGTVYTESSGLNIGTLIGTLKSLVNSISSIPSIFAQLVTFVPEWFISMLMISIGLIVTIGIVKIIIR